MKCSCCGREISGRARFCPSCGSEVISGGPEFERRKPKRKHRKHRWIPVFIIMLLLLVSVAAVAVLFYRRAMRRVSVGPYLTISCEGGNGSASVSAGLDKPSLYNAILLRRGELPRPAEQYEQISDDVKLLIENAEISFDKESGLKNGDEVTATVKFDTELQKLCGVELIDCEKSFTLSGLQDLVELDPFEAVKITFSGVAPYIELSIDNESEHELLQNAEYSAERSEGLDLGEQVTIKVDLTEEEAAEYGYHLSQTEITCNVEGCSSYVRSIGEISQNLLTLMQTEASDQINAYIAQNYPSGAAVTDWKYEGLYFLYGKQDTEPWNEAILVYSGEVNYPEENVNRIRNYYPVRFDSLVKLTTGEQQYDQLEGPCGRNGAIFDNNWNYIGYTNGIDLYREELVAQKDQYYTEVSDGLKKFGE